MAEVVSELCSPHVSLDGMQAHQQACTDDPPCCLVRQQEAWWTQIMSFVSPCYILASDICTERRIVEQADLIPTGILGHMPALLACMPTTGFCL